MVTRDEVAELLRLHDKAYQLLLWLGQRAVRHPKALSPEVVQQLARPATCAEWLAASRLSLPANVLPDKGMQDAFVNLFSSFFSTSFHVEHVSLGNKLLDSSLSTGSSAGRRNPSGFIAAQALALRHLGGSENIRISDAEARTLAKRKSMQPNLLLWTYVWELDRRAKGKGKGEVVHRIWRSLPVDLRKNMTTEAVWEARNRLLETLGSFAAETQ